MIVSKTLKLQTLGPQMMKRAAAASRNMSSTAKVWVDKNTKVICQGFTGKQVCGYLAFLEGVE